MCVCVLCVCVSDLSSICFDSPSHRGTPSSVFFFFFFFFFFSFVVSIS